MCILHEWNAEQDLKNDHNDVTQKHTFLHEEFICKTDQIFFSHMKFFIMLLCFYSADWLIITGTQKKT